MATGSSSVLIDQSEGWMYRGHDRQAGQLYALGISVRNGNTALSASAMASKNDGFDSRHSGHGHLITENFSSAGNAGNASRGSPDRQAAADYIC